MTPRMISPALAALSLALALPSAAKAEVIALDTTTLPSTQGWRYAAYGDGTATPETSVYSVGAGLLRLDTMGIGMTQGGGNWYERSVTLSAGDHWSMTLVGSLLTFESVTSPLYPLGLCFGANNGIAVGFGSDNIQYVGEHGIESAPLPVGFDAERFNTYRLDVNGGRQTFTINGETVFFNRPTPAGTPGGILFGDGTGFANTRADIQSFVFTSAVPEPQTWLLMLMGAGLLALRPRARRPSRPHAAIDYRNRRHR